MTTKKDSPSDSQIVTLILKGDVDMFALIVERYEAKLMRYAIYLLKDYDVASDITQETFINAYINLRSYKIDKSFSPWIYRILHNNAMNFIKKSKKTCALGAIDEIGDDFIVKFNSDKLLDKNMLNIEVRKCLGKIDIKYQEILGLNFFDNLKYDEISDILHIPTSTVGVRIRRAKMMLKKVCLNNGVNYE
ncbi:MAG: RNA polymerase sigma factor [Candidatus Saccharibacteria bacterium]